MNPDGAVVESSEVVVSRRRLIVILDNRFLAPIFITCILVAAHLSFGILESYDRVALAIGTAIATELTMGRITFRRWPHPASAYITGISVGILLRSPFAWPYVLGSFISIASKYVLRVKGRHLWNPSNFGVSTILFLGPVAVTVLSIQWGNTMWPMVVIWVLGAVTVWRVGRLHISATYVASFLLFSLIRSAITGSPWLASVAPITGPMYQLYIFFMVTDPKRRFGRCQDSVSSSSLWHCSKRYCGLRSSSTLPFMRCSLLGQQRCCSTCCGDRTRTVRATDESHSPSRPASEPPPPRSSARTENQPHRVPFSKFVVSNGSIARSMRADSTSRSGS